MNNLKYWSKTSNAFSSLLRFTKEVSQSSSGFTMMEVLIASGLMGVAALGMMQLQKSSSEGQNRARTSMEIISLQQNLKQRFLNSAICMGTLNDAGVNFSTANITGYDDQAASPTVEPPASSKSFTNITRQLFDVDGVPTTTETLDTLEDKYNGERIILKKLHIFDLQSTGATIGGLQKHEVTIRVGYLRKKNLQQADADGSMMFSYVKLETMVAMASAPQGYDWASTGDIVKCFSSEGNAIVSSMKAACLMVDIDGVNGPDNEWDETQLKCFPKASEGYCQYGGSYSESSRNQAKYPNPITGGFNCPDPSFTRVQTGHFMRPEAYSCGKLQCYRFYQTTQFTCLKCYGTAGATVQINPVAGRVPGYICETGVSCGSGSGGGLAPSAVSYCTDVTCGAGEYGMDNNGDGCDDSCFDPSSISGPTP